MSKTNYMNRHRPIWHSCCQHVLTQKKFPNKLTINFFNRILMEWVFMKMKIISWGLTDLPASQYQFLDDTKYFVTSKNWCWLAGKSVKCHDMIFIFIKTHSMSILLKKLVVNLLNHKTCLLNTLWIRLCIECRNIFFVSIYSGNN